MSIHDLTEYETKLSKQASERLGIKVVLYQDGDWICQPHSIKFLNGYGTHSAAAEKDCKERNNLK